MFIRCPECGFERELNASQIPDSAVMATCPQCRHRFRFRDYRVDEDATPQIQVPGTPKRAASPGQSAAARARRASPAKASPDEDDPLPPGAITPAGSKNSRASQRPPQVEPEQDAKEDAKEEDNHQSYHPEMPPRPDAGREDRRSLFSGAGASELAWEIAPLGHLPVALYQTILQALFAAPAFFTLVGASRASLLRPSAFYVLIGTFQSLVQHFWLISRLNEMASLQDPKIQATLDAVTQNLSLPMLLISMPPMLLVMLLFYSVLFNLMVRLVQPDRANLSTTLRVVAYSAAPGVLCIVPVVGAYAVSIWFAFCCFVGCKYALGLKWQRTVLAILPIYVLFTAFSLQASKVLMGLAQ